MRYLLIVSMLCLSLAAEEFNIQLQNPLFSGGTISTTEGGIISGPDLRIQADHISYTHKTENGNQIKQVQAKGNLLLEYQKKIFVGEELEYNLMEKTGVMKQGRTSTDYWFVGGDEIEILSNGSFLISDAYLTTVESQNPWWQLHSSKINVSSSSLLSAKNIKIRFFNIPVFWFPTFKMDLKLLKEPPIRYRFIWDQILKQKISMRYELYSTETFSLFGRLDYRFHRGPGAAIETTYNSLDKRTLFQTKNYVAHDKIVPDEKGNKRYRFQGLITTYSSDEKTKFRLSYDKLSDDKMPQDFKGDDFEVNTQQKTALWISQQTDNTFSTFNLQPRINNFQSINQQLPLMTLNIRPFPLGNSDIIVQNQLSAGYLNYIYARGVADELSSSRSARLETRNTLYRPFHLGPLQWTPWVGLIALYYSTSPQHHARTQASGSYGFQLQSTFYKNTPHFSHTVKPYLTLQGLTSPLTSASHHFVFNLDDGLAKQALFRPGILQSFYPASSAYLPNITLDFYTNIFLGKTAFHRTIPKLYTTCEFSYPSWRISTDIVYNLQELLFDRTNINSAWTVNENAAFTLEFRHRSKYDWRKCDHDNYIMDIQQSIASLLHSDLSDERNTLLTSFQFRFSPLWTCHLQSHQGWSRAHEPRYDAYEIKFTTLLTGRWQLEFGYKYSPSTREWLFPSIKLLSAKF